MLDALVGLGLLLWCVGVFAYKYYFNVDLDGKMYVQAIVSGLGSMVILGPMIWRYLPKIELNNNNKEEDDMYDNSKDATASEKELNDFKCLYYLKHRSIELKSNEAFELVVKLNSLLFKEGANKKPNDGEKNE